MLEPNPGGLVVGAEGRVPEIPSRMPSEVATAWIGASKAGAWAKTCKPADSIRPATEAGSGAISRKIGWRPTFIFADPSRSTISSQAASRSGNEPESSPSAVRVRRDLSTGTSQRAEPQAMMRKA